MTPFFSIALPTKNRSHIIGDALRCALDQTFSDYEIVVMDNSDDDRTREVVKQFNDPRLRYHRSGGLSMADNWEAAMRQAVGEYTTVIEDKQLLYARALTTIYEAVSKELPLVAQWYVDALNNTNASACVFSNLHGKRYPATEYVSSITLLQNFIAKGHWGVPYLLPKGFNSTVHRSLYQTARQGPAGRLCLANAPDYTMGFVQLAYTERVLQINQALSTIAWAGSTGLSNTLKDKQGTVVQFVADAGREKLYDRVPIHSHTLANNVVYNDFLRVQSLVNGNLSKITFDLVAYFSICFDEIVRREKMGVDMSDEQTAWNLALNQQKPDIQSAIRHAIEPYERQRVDLRRDLFMDKVGITRVIGKIQQLRGKPVAAAIAESVPLFPSLLAAVEWEAHGEYTGVLATQVK